VSLPFGRSQFGTAVSLPCGRSWLCASCVVATWPQPVGAVVSLPRGRSQFGERCVVASWPQPVFLMAAACLIQGASLPHGRSLFGAAVSCRLAARQTLTCQKRSSCEVEEATGRQARGKHSKRVRVQAGCVHRLCSARRQAFGKRWVKSLEE
jgi:hypothetical protein